MVVKKKNGRRGNPHPTGLNDPLTGKIKPGPGRKKGSPNKSTMEVKQALSWCFEGMGGRDRLLEWAEKNPTIFYTQMYIKMLPMLIKADVTATVETNEQARAAFIRGITGLITAKRDEARRVNGPANSGDSAKDGVTIDVEPNRDAEPRLVLVGKTGRADTE